MQKLRVGVFMGGKSIEKEASFNSARTICDHLDNTRYKIIPLFQDSQGSLYILPWRFLHRGKISDFEQRLETDAQKISWSSLKTIIDFMYIAAHGRFAEDGTLQGFLEVLQIPYLGSKVLSSALGMNKVMQKDILRAHGIHVPASTTINCEQLKTFMQNEHALYTYLEQEQIPIPCIVKPQAGGSSLGVTAVFGKQQLLPALLKAAKLVKKNAESVLIEEFINGMEFTCIIITDYSTGELLPLPPTEIVPEEGSFFFTYEQKYMPGRALKFTPARCNDSLLKAIQVTSITAMQALGITNLARIDGFVTQDSQIVITDPNSLAGMAPSSFVFRQAAELNMSHTQFINHLIETELHGYSMLSPLGSHLSGAEVNHKKIRVAVLLGGRSHEKEISLESGRNVIYKLSPQAYQAIPIFVTAELKLYRIDQALLVRNSTKEIELGLDRAMQINWEDLPTIADFVFIGLHGGEGENGCVQGTLEMLEIPYNGSSVLASALCMDKFKLNSYLKSKGFYVPNNILIDRASWMKNPPAVMCSIESVGSLPLIVKPSDDGCSVLVKKVNSSLELQDALEAIFSDGKEHALVEEFIKGMELTVGVLGNQYIQALPASQAVSAQDILSIEEKFLPGAGENQTPAPLPSSASQLVARTMENVYRSAQCKGYARIDSFYQNAQESPTGAERVVILEINTLPGLTPATCLFHQAAEIGMTPMDFIDRIIQLGFEEHQKNTEQIFDLSQLSHSQLDAN